MYAAQKSCKGKGLELYTRLFTEKHAKVGQATSMSKLNIPTKINTLYLHTSDTMWDKRRVFFCVELCHYIRTDTLY